MIEHFERPDGLAPVNGYSHAVAGTGRLVTVCSVGVLAAHHLLREQAGA